MGAPKVNKAEAKQYHQSIDDGLRKRRFRYKPEPSRSAKIFVEENGQQEKISGLIVNESYTGCRLVVLNYPYFEFDKKFQVEITPGLVLNAELRWMKKLGEVAYEVGFEFVE